MQLVWVILRKEIRLKMKISFLAYNEMAERNSCKIHYFSLNKLTQIIKKKKVVIFPLEHSI